MPRGSIIDKSPIGNAKWEKALRIAIFVLFIVYVLLIIKITVFKYASLEDIFAGRIGRCYSYSH